MINKIVSKGYLKETIFTRVSLFLAIENIAINKCKSFNNLIWWILNLLMRQRQSYVWI